MKRVLVATIVLGLMVSGAAAQSNEVNSVNAVGFLKVNLPVGFSQLAFNWGEVGGDDGVSVQGLFDTSVLHGTMNQPSSDKIFIRDAVSNAYVQLWLYNSQGTYPSWDGKWLNLSDGKVSSTEIARGSGFWFENTGTGSVDVSISGEVPNDASKTNLFVEGFTMFGFAYSADMDINAQNWSGGHGTMNQPSSDKIFMWDSASNTYVQLWLYNSQGTYPSWDGKWLNLSDGKVSTKKMPLGQGAWYGRVNETNMPWTQTKPYSL